MTSIGDILDSNSINKIAKGTIQVGNVYRIKMDKSNGITPKKGDLSRNKYFIVLGFDSNDNAYGGVIINSKINQAVPESIKDWQMPIKCTKYTFLEHNSFVDCSELKTAKIEKFAQWLFMGMIENDDVEIITNTIKESPNETKEHLVLFGL